MTSLDLDWIREQFPALQQELNGQPIVFFDGPGGTQVPRTSIAAMGDYLLHSNANAHGAFLTSAQTDGLIASARSAVASLLGCDADEVVFGANMTTLTFAISRAIGRELQPGDEIIVTRLDHDANVTPWSTLAAEGVVLRVVDINSQDCTLDMDSLEQMINERTRVVAIGYASNAVGTINDIAAVVRIAHAVGALVFVDAVHYVPHGPIDVQTLDCDFLTCSAYKFFGPHIGILYGKRRHLARLLPYKVRPAPDDAPGRWETGTQNHEGMAGLIATLHYLTELGHQISPQLGNRAALIQAMEAIQHYERKLARLLIPGLLQIPDLTIYGITEPSCFSWRTPTVALRLKGQTPYAVAKELGDRGIFVWHGNFYALGLTQRLELEASGGFVRIGLVHYNTEAEVNRLLKALNEITTSHFHLNRG
ncbi:cysteine desulfurase-like protein [Leptolyngbya sp. FACHB-541]|uniref:cysteine desulfurase-like protein n=1 Tax=Leptolyngbya sp. FACHB-541 TaxID=2692810 RepID=UPI0016886B03|nr:cysteine desulfurase-like protein [Leptolyngbya sp. FACHB-541]MBD1997510.1 cysteine desulfurase-like protein [Leptolyngbya sp. FACHB-541]